ncbi:MAG: hypothetical protein AAGF12_03490 [Myxococcota bacterium]
MLRNARLYDDYAYRMRCGQGRVGFQVRAQAERDTEFGVEITIRRVTQPLEG